MRDARAPVGTRSERGRPVRPFCLRCRPRRKRRAGRPRSGTGPLDHAFHPVTLWARQPWEDRRMDFVIAVATAADSWKVVQRAEEHGFTRSWFYDTQMLHADCFVAMGAAAVKARRLRLATAVLIPSHRHATGRTSQEEQRR